jgi:nucleotide-binding universal stress UspA family protein
LREIGGRELDDPSIVERCCALRGPTAAALSQEATRTEIDMIAVGAGGAGGSLRSLLGSISRELTECPAQVVAVVPPDERTNDTGPRPILVGVDGSDGSARALRWAADAAGRAGGEVVAVHAFGSPIPDPTRTEEVSLLHERRERLEQEWCAPLRAGDVSYQAVVEGGDPREVMRRVADEVRPICGVVGSRGLGAISSRLLGSVTHHLVRELAWPVVIVPSARDLAIWPPPAAADHL